MSTDLAPMVDADTVARVLLHGDLKQLTPSQKIQYYRAVCESVGLNPLTQPFSYIVLNGKEVLYALKNATDQLRAVHHVAITIAGRELVEDTYVVTARAQLPDGRTDESIGAVPLGGLKGESRANAMMKAETKAKRRVTLSMVGLGMLDETEVESLPMGALAPAPSQAAGTSPAAAGCSVPAAATEGNRGTPAPPLKRVDPDTARSLGTFTKAEAIGAAIKQELIDQGRYHEPVTDQVTADLPAGFVRIERIDSAPTKNPNVLKFTITLSTGEIVGTINTWLASLATTYCEERTPVRVKTRNTKYGVDLIALMTGPEGDPPEPPASDADIPF